MEEYLKPLYFIALGWVVLFVFLCLKKRRSGKDWFFALVGIVILSFMCIGFLNAREGKALTELPPAAKLIYILLGQGIAYLIGSYAIGGSLRHFILSTRVYVNRRETWESMLAVGKELGFNHRTPDSEDKRDWYGALIGKLEGFEFAIGCKTLKNLTSFNQEEITVDFPHPLPGFLVHTEGTECFVPAKAQPYKTGNQDFDRLFPKCFGTKEVEAKILNAPEVQNAISAFYKKWIEPQHMEITEKGIRFGRYKGSYIPFEASIPGENKFLFRPDQIAQAQRAFMDELLRLTKLVTAAVGHPRYYQSAKI